MRKIIFCFLLLTSAALWAQTFSGTAGDTVRVPPPFKLCLGIDNGQDDCFIQSGVNSAKISGFFDFAWTPKTVATLPSATLNLGRTFRVTDGASASDCVTGLGSTSVICTSNGASWVPMGGAGGGGGSPGGLNGNLQFNVAGVSFGGTSGWTTNGSTTIAGIGSSIMDFSAMSIANLKFPSCSANFFIAAANGSPGSPTCRAIVSADLPATIAANTTGTSVGFTGNLAGDVTGTQAAAVVGKINGTSLAGLATGFLRNTTGTGVPSSGELSGDATTSGSLAVTVAGLKTVPFCTGFTPTNGQAIQYTTASAPNPCYTATTFSGSFTAANNLAGTSISQSVVSIGPTDGSGQPECDVNGVSTNHTSISACVTYLASLGFASSGTIRSFFPEHFTTNVFAINNFRGKLILGQQTGSGATAVCNVGSVYNCYTTSVPLVLPTHMVIEGIGNPSRSQGGFNSGSIISFDSDYPAALGPPPTPALTCANSGGTIPDNTTVYVQISEANNLLGLANNANANSTPGYGAASPENFVTCGAVGGGTHSITFAAPSALGSGQFIGQDLIVFSGTTSGGEQENTRGTNLATTGGCGTVGAVDTNGCLIAAGTITITAIPAAKTANPPPLVDLSNALITLGTGIPIVNGNAFGTRIQHLTLSGCPNGAGSCNGMVPTANEPTTAVNVFLAEEQSGPDDVTFTGPFTQSLIYSGYKGGNSTIRGVHMPSNDGPSPPGSGTAYSITSVNTTGVYQGTFTGCATNGCIGFVFSITGFTNSNNNISNAVVTASTATALTFSATTTTETHAATGTGGQFTITAVNTAGVYTGTFTGGGSNAYAGYVFTISGFANSVNNLKMAVATASTTTTLSFGAITVTESLTSSVSGPLFIPIILDGRGGGNGGARMLLDSTIAARCSGCTHQPIVPEMVLLTGTTVGMNAQSVHIENDDLGDGFLVTNAASLVADNVTGFADAGKCLVHASATADKVSAFLSKVGKNIGVCDDVTGKSYTPAANQGVFYSNQLIGGSLEADGTWLPPVFSSDPATCTEGMYYHNSTSHAPKYCSATNTWTAFGSGSGISGLTTGFIPKAASSTTIANSLADDGITTASTFSYSGSGGIAATAGPLKSGNPAGGVGSSLFMTQEGTIPGSLSAAGQDNCYADSTQHGILCNFNAGSTLPIVQGPASATSGHLATWSGTNGGKLVDGGAVPGGGTPCTTTALSIQYNNAGAFGCEPDVTFSTPHTFLFGASGILDLSATAPTAGLKLPSVAGAVPTADGFIGFNLTTHALVTGSNGTTIVQAAAATGTNTSTTCTNQFFTVISSVAAPTCTGATLASAQFANQGTTTTVLHGNGAGNPSFGSIVAGDITNNTITGTQLAASLALVTPLLGTPTSGVLTNETGYLENNLTGAAAAGTITEGGATFSVTRAGIATANLTAPWVFLNTNSSNNNTSITAGFSAPGTSTGQSVVNINNAATGGDFLDLGTGGTWTAGVLSGQTIVDSFGITGLTKFGAGPAITAGTGGGAGWTCGTAPTGVASNETQYCDAANQPHALSGTTDLGIIATQSQTAVLTSDWTCGTGGTNTTCVAAGTIGTLTFTLPLEAKNWSFDCNLVVGQATAATANNWDIQTATNGATNTMAAWQMSTAATAYASGALTGQASGTTSVDIGVTWTLGGTATKMPVHLFGTIEGASASGTVLNFQLKAPTVADLVTIYRGSACRIF